MKRHFLIVHPQSLFWLMTSTVAGVVGVGGCDNSPIGSQERQDLVFRNAEGPLDCQGQTCSQSQSPLPNDVNQFFTWDPCNGAAFSYTVDGNMENNYDHLTIGNRRFTGVFANRAGSAPGPVVLRLFTDSSVSSVGVRSLRAICSSQGTSTNVGTTSASGTNSAPGSPSRPLTCTGLRCVTSNPLANRVRVNVTWNPCNGGAFSFAGQASFERSYDYLRVGNQSITGINRSFSGRANGPINVSVSTDTSVNSPGISSLLATCDDNSGTTTTEDTTSSSNSATSVASTSEQTSSTSEQSSSTTTDQTSSTSEQSSSTTTADQTTTTTPPPPVGSEFLRCQGDRCRTVTSPIPDSTRVSTQWDPCNGGAFSYSGAIRFERTYDHFWVDNQRYTGYINISGNASGPVTLRLLTDLSVASPGVDNLIAQCETNTSTTGEETTSTTSAGDPTTSTTDQTSSSTTSDDTTSDPALTCNGLNCVSVPSTIPANQNLSATWDPCNGNAFSVNGSIALNENIGRPTRDFLQIGDFVFTGSRAVQLNLSGPTNLNLVTVAAGNRPSNGIQSLTANCTPEAYGLTCSGTSCQIGASILPGNFNQQAQWDPCGGQGFTWEGEISVEPNSDFVIIAGTRYTGTNTSVSGSATGPITVQVRTDRFGDSQGIRSLTATCNNSGGGNGGGTSQPFPGPLMTDWNADEISRYGQTVEDYIAAEGIQLLNNHSAWHARNDTNANSNGDGGISGNRGPGSGMSFLGMHRAMMNKFRLFAESNPNRVTPRPLNPYAALPANLADALPALRRLPGANTGWYRPRTRTSYANSGVGIPRFLMIGGAGRGSGQAVGNSYRLKNDRHISRAGRNITALEQFASPDEIGEAMGVSGYHGRGHWWIGGTMGISRSPLDPVFWGWHQLLDDILQNWLDNTQAGIRWAKANVGHPILSRTDTDIGKWVNLETTLTHRGILMP